MIGGNRSGAKALVTAGSSQVETWREGSWSRLEHADDTPVFPCRVGQVADLLASAWLSLHIDDGSDYVQANRMQVITPYFIDRSEDPVLLLTRDGVLVEQPLVVGESFVADLLAPHALLPRMWADQVLALGRDDFAEFRQWWEPLYDDEDVAPVLAWASVAAKG